ncbi:5-oxoprolinase subunit PxpB [Paracandidimonas lactea]|uniref:5-oxoprolinase subunit PxpB n=1 Tax=Paracandidimonas lactea TaxID=2895524 RepID=UPI001EF0A885|nr:5-oxoprolinase subunit PxpB [Paracandidimonas lactea]
MPGTADSLSASWSLTPQGDRCLLIGLGSGIDVRTGRRCARVAQALRDAAIPGVTDLIPTFNAVAVHIDPSRFGSGGHVQVREEIEQVLRGLPAADDAHTPGRTVDIPVCYGGEYGPDLEYVAAHCGLAPEDVINLHSAEPVYVFMLGFAPGAAYIGVHDERLAIGRRETPRTRLPAGSVAIANRQTMIYPNESPGGWHILGRTPVVLFDPQRDPATLLAPGDTVRFRPISASEYAALQHTREANA